MLITTIWYKAGLLSRRRCLRVPMSSIPMSMRLRTFSVMPLRSTMCAYLSRSMTIVSSISASISNSIARLSSHFSCGLSCFTATDSIPSSQWPILIVLQTQEGSMYKTRWPLSRGSSVRFTPESMNSSASSLMPRRNIWLRRTISWIWVSPLRPPIYIYRAIICSIP